MNRRAFLTAAAAAPLVYGLREVFALQDPGAPEWYGRALRRMKEEGRRGVVLVTPEAGSAREAFGAALLRLLEAPDAAVREILCGAVFVCLTPELAQSLLGAKAGDRILLAPDGSRISADTAAPEAFADAAAFAQAFDPLVHGDLRERAEAAERGMAPALRKAAEALDSESIEEREAATAALAEAGEILPWLAWRRRTAENPEERGRCEEAIRRRYESAPADAPGPRLPYGCESQPAQVSVDPCPPCGMAVVPPGARRFLRFLTGK